MTGQQPEELLARLGEEAARSVARELVLDAAADQLGIEIPDAEIEELVHEQAALVGDDADATLLRCARAAASSSSATTSACATRSTASPPR